jgi:hypothetical protein
MPRSLSIAPRSQLQRNKGSDLLKPDPHDGARLPRAPPSSSGIRAESQRGQVVQGFANPLVADVYARHDQSKDRALLERAGGNALAREKARSDPTFRPVVLRGLDLQDVPARKSSPRSTCLASHYQNVSGIKSLRLYAFVHIETGKRIWLRRCKASKRSLGRQDAKTAAQAQRP